MVDTPMITVTAAGRRYRITRAAGDAPGTTVELWPGIGFVGSERPWRGTHWAKGLRWWAAVNPSGQPGKALLRAEGFPSRRAAVVWLLANAQGVAR